MSLTEPEEWDNEYTYTVMAQKIDNTILPVVSAFGAFGISLNAAADAFENFTTAYYDPKQEWMCSYCSTPNLKEKTTCSQCGGARHFIY